MANRIAIDIAAQDKTGAAFNAVQGKASKLTSVLKGLAVGFSAVQVARFGADAIRSADEINKLSERLGASTEALSEYQFVAERTGVSFKNITDGFQKLSRRTAEAARGQGEAKDTLRELGIEAEKLAQLAPEQQFEIIADAIAGVENQSEKLRISQKLFDSENVKLLQTLQKGSGGIRELRDEAQELGRSLSQEGADAASRAADAWTNLSSAGDSLAISLVESIGPAAADVANWLAETIPAAANVAGEAFNSLQVFIAEAASGVTSVLASIEGKLADAAEFLGADTVAKALRKTQESYQETSDTFSRVAERLTEAQEKVAQSRAQGTQPAIALEQVYNAELQREAQLKLEISEEDKKRAAEQARINEQRLSSIASIVEGLKTEAETLGFTNAQLEEYNLNKLGAAQATRDQAAALREQIDDFEAIRAAEEENKRVFEESEKLVQKQQEETAKAAEQAFGRTVDSITGAIDAADSFGEALENVLTKLAEMAIQQAAASIAGGGGGAGGGLGGLGAGLFSMLGFASGGTPPRGRPFLVGEGGQPEVMQVGGPASVSSRLKVDVNLTGGGAALQDPVARSSLITGLGREIARNMSRNT